MLVSPCLSELLCVTKEVLLLTDVPLLSPTWRSPVDESSTQMQFRQSRCAWPSLQVDKTQKTYIDHETGEVNWGWLFERWLFHCLQGRTKTKQTKPVFLPGNLLCIMPVSPISASQGDLTQPHPQCDLWHLCGNSGIRRKQAVLLFFSMPFKQSGILLKNTF